MPVRHPVLFKKNGSTMNLQTEVGKLNRVGPKTVELLTSHGIYTVSDLVNHYPMRYEQYTPLCAVSQAQEGKNCAVLLTVIGRGSNVRAGKRAITHFKAGDATGDCRITFYNMPYMTRTLTPGSQRVFMGVMKKSPRGLYYMEQPRVYSLDDYHDLEGTLQPVYPLFQGMKNKQMTSLIGQALDGLPAFEDYLSDAERAKLQLCTRNEALHSPSREHGKAGAGQKPADL